MKPSKMYADWRNFWNWKKYQIDGLFELEKKKVKKMLFEAYYQKLRNLNYIERKIVLVVAWKWDSNFNVKC